MLTFTTAYNRAINMVGISPNTNLQDVINMKSDVNQGLRLFKNASRRYWTRKEVSANLVAGQQYYIEVLHKQYTPHE